MPPLEIWDYTDKTYLPKFQLMQIMRTEKLMCDRVVGLQSRFEER